MIFSIGNRFKVRQLGLHTCSKVNRSLRLLNSTIAFISPDAALSANCFATAMRAETVFRLPFSTIEIGVSAALKKSCLSCPSEIRSGALRRRPRGLRALTDLKIFRAVFLLQQNGATLEAKMALG